MLKQISNGFKDFKCGEVLCASATEYSVNCCLCQERVVFEQFPLHFRSKHLGFQDKEEPQKVEFSEPDVDPFAITVKCELKELDEPMNDFLEETEDYLGSTDALGNVESTLNVLEPLVDVKPRITSDGELSEHGQEFSWQADSDEGGEVLPLSSAIGCKTKKLKKPQTARKTSKTSDQSKPKKQKSSAKKSAQIEKDDTIIVNSDNDEKSSDNDAGIDDLWDEKLLPPKKNAKKKKPPGMVTVRKLTCSICFEVILGSRELAAHRKMHKDFRKCVEDGTLEAGVAVFKCEVESCGEVLPCENMLKGHETKHTGFPCEICGHRFTHMTNLSAHRIRHTGQRNFACDECDYKAFTDRELRDHKNCHDRRFICDTCGRACINQRELTKHIRHHTGERPYKCEVCGKCFVTPRDLKDHSISHTAPDYRPFECHCGYRTKTKKALHVHQKVHETVKPYECEQCGKAFAKEKGLKSHMYSHDPAVVKSMKENTSRKRKHPIVPPPAVTLGCDPFLFMVQNLDHHMYRTG